MTFKNFLIAGIVGATMIASSSALRADEAAEKAAEARQSVMQLYAFNLGLLGGMAKGAVEYDAESAQAAATNLHTLASMNQMAMWIPGSGLDVLGDETDALPAIWEADSKVMDHAQELVDATAAIETAAGAGIEELRGAMQPVGKACGGCHELYRQKD